MIDKTILDFFHNYLLDPLSKSGVEKINDTQVRFQGMEYPIFSNAPVIFNEKESLFSITDIEKDVKKTQNSEFRDKSIFKNRFRQSLPKLAHDFGESKRFEWLKEKAGNGPVLIIGSGDKCEFYKNKFNNCLVINSDVHNQFGVDIVFDAHNIPFKDNTFQLVYSSQVLEHTLKPWVVSKEISRVTKTGGFIHTEVPFCFPYHGQPYDFYRFTPGGLRLLFQQCELVRDEVISGGGSSSAYMLSESLINKFSGRYPRIISLFLARFLLFWLKYTEYFDPKASKSRVVAAMNIGQTYKKDLKERSNKDMLEEIRVHFA
ncbi:MAG TPA: methyltransferase domain-containing protein [Chryseolinea sp.]|nr:methyltransferase domain-containing protein [Chryseolinea sp.]